MGWEYRGLHTIGPEISEAFTSSGADVAEFTPPGQGYWGIHWGGGGVTPSGWGYWGIYTIGVGGVIGGHSHHWGGDTGGVCTIGVGHWGCLHHCSRDIGSIHTTIGRGPRGHSPLPQLPQCTAYLLTVFHRFSLRELRPSHLVPSPLDCPVQELLHLSLREDGGVPEQLVFILIDCVQKEDQGQLQACGSHLKKHTLTHHTHTPGPPSQHLQKTGAGLCV